MPKHHDSENRLKIRHRRVLQRQQREARRIQSIRYSGIPDGYLRDSRRDRHRL